MLTPGRGLLSKDNRVRVATHGGSSFTHLYQEEPAWKMSMWTDTGAGSAACKHHFNQSVGPGDPMGAVSADLASRGTWQIPVEKVSKSWTILLGRIQHQGVLIQGAPVTFQDLDTVR